MQEQPATPCSMPTVRRRERRLLVNYHRRHLRPGRHALFADERDARLTDGTTGPKPSGPSSTRLTPARAPVHPHPVRQLRRNRLTASQKASNLIEEPSATLGAPWSQTIVGGVTDSSPAVLIEGHPSSTVIGGSGVTSGTIRQRTLLYQAAAGDGILTAYFPSGISERRQRPGLYHDPRIDRQQRRHASAVAAPPAPSAPSWPTAHGGRQRDRLPATALTASNLAAGCGSPARPALHGRSSKVARLDRARHPPRSAAGPPALWGVFHLTPTTTIPPGPPPRQPRSRICPCRRSLQPGRQRPTPTAVTLTWTSVPGASGYVIERLTENRRLC
jgi:hypothetical protein